ncbi:MAG: hypothetical protein H8D45_27360 [Bacteroidetes bacterium]|nr:hypothetical protein [Bacteroidota bacterium]
MEKFYRLPLENVNEEYATITAIYFKTGYFIKKGDIIFSFETTKAVMDVEAEGEGYIFYIVSEGQRIKVGSTVCVISSIREFDIKSIIDNDITVEQEKIHDYRLTKKAEKLALEHSINIANIGKKGIIKERDILEILENREESINYKVEREFKSNDIVIIGNGGHARMCKDLIEKVGHYKIVGIIDKNYSDSNVPGYEVIGNDNSLPILYRKGLMNAVIGVGDISNSNKTRSRLYNNIKAIGISLPNIIDPSSTIEKTAILGDGIQIMSNAIIGSYSSIGDNCIINSGSIVCHDARISNNVHVAPGAIIAADVEIGRNTLIGMGVTIYRGIKIGSNVVINNGVNIFSNVNDSKIVR